MATDENDQINFSDRATRAITLICRIMNMLSVISLVAMLAITVFDVLLRHILKSPISDCQRITEYLIVCVAFFSLAFVANQGGHISVDLIASKLSKEVQTFLDSITTILTILICFIMAWRNASEAAIVKKLGGGSPLLDVPAYPFYFIISISLFAFCIVNLVQLIQHIMKAIKK